MLLARKTSHRFDGYLHHKDHEGSNALHLAVVNNHYENVKLLLEAGAQVNYPRVRVIIYTIRSHMRFIFAYTFLKLSIERKMYDIDQITTYFTRQIPSAPSMIRPSSVAQHTGVLYFCEPKKTLVGCVSRLEQI